MLYYVYVSSIIYSVLYIIYHILLFFILYTIQYILYSLHSLYYILYIIDYILWHWVSAHQGHSSDAALAAQATYVAMNEEKHPFNQEKRKGNQPEVGDWNHKKLRTHLTMDSRFEIRDSRSEISRNWIYHYLIYQWSSTDISSTDHQKQGLNQEKLAYGQQKECKPQK